MRMHACTVVSVASAVTLGATALGAAAAGPAPAVLIGAPGIAVAGGTHVVTAPSAGGSTHVGLVRDRDGAAIRSRPLPGRLGVPMITFSGLVEGTWSKGRRLVLATSIYDDPSHTTFVTLDTRTLAPLRTIRLPGSFAFDAVSPDGRRLYVLQYPGGVQGGVRYVVRSLSLATGRLDTGRDRRPDGAGRADERDRAGARVEPERSLGVHAVQRRRLPRVRPRAEHPLANRPLHRPAVEGHRAERARGHPDVGEQGRDAHPDRSRSRGVLARIDTRTFRVDVLRAPVTS